MALNLKTVFIFQIFVVFVSCNVNSTCPPGTVQSPYVSQVCFKFINNSVTFTEADHDCFSLGGRLAEIDDQFTNTFLSSNAYTNFGQLSNFWIGGYLRLVQSYSIWTWIRTDEFVSYADWDQPDAGTSSKGECVSVSASEATWTPQNCSVKLPYVCQMSPSYSISECESEWTFYDHSKKCYKVFTLINSTFASAERDCVYHGGHLASIHDENENDFVGRMTSTLSVLPFLAEGVMIGMYFDDSKNECVWSDGSPTNYINWGEHDPDFSSSYCGCFYADGIAQNGYADYIRKWDAMPIGEAVNRYICKKDPTVSSIKLSSN